MAKKLKKLLIASAGGNTIFGISQAIHSQRIVTETDILEYLEQSYVPEPSRVPISIVNREGKWLTIQSMFPNRTLKTRYNRVAAKGILATLRQSGCLSVYDGIGYISKNPYNPSIFSPDMILFQNSVTNAESQAPGYLFTDALPVLRDLGPTMLAASVNRPLQFNRLNPAIQGMIAQLVFSKEMALQMEDHQMGDPSLNGKDPTEVFPNGIPENAILEIGVKEEAAVLARSSKGYYFQLSMYQLATELEKGNLRSVSPGTTEKPREYIAFAPIFIKSYEIKLHLGKRTLLSVGSRGATRMPGSQETKIDSLPPGHLAALAEARKIFAPDPG